MQRNCDAPFSYALKTVTYARNHHRRHCYTSADDAPSNGANAEIRPPL